MHHLDAPPWCTPLMLHLDAPPWGNCVKVPPNLKIAYCSRCVSGCDSRENALTSFLRTGHQGVCRVLFPVIKRSVHFLGLGPIYSVFLCCWTRRDHGKATTNRPVTMLSSTQAVGAELINELYVFCFSCSADVCSAECSKTRCFWWQGKPPAAVKITPPNDGRGADPAVLRLH